MNTNASEKSRQYTISEVERHGRIMLGTKIPVGTIPKLAESVSFHM